MKDIDDDIFIKIYLDGDMPIGFKKLSKSVKDMLDEFRIYSGNRLQYQFIDPNEGDEKTRNALINDLYNKGLQPTNVKVKDPKGGLTEQMVVPGLIISRGSMEIPVNLLVKNQGADGEENLNLSIQNIEYLLASNIYNICQDSICKIAFLEGQGELSDVETTDITRELSKFYQVDRGTIGGTMHLLDHYKAVIVAKPSKPFAEEDKFVLDQYLMHGGKLIFFVDGVEASADSLSSGGTMAFVKDLNLNDMLFKYGVRINPNLIQDVQCAVIPVNTAPAGENAKFAPAPWPYFPLLTPAANNPVTRNLNVVRCEFVSSIDTLSNNLKKSVLLSSSAYTKTSQVPFYITLEELKKELQQSEYSSSFLPAAVMLEGKFGSAFRNRMYQSLNVKGEYTFLDSSQNTAIAVIADGGMIANGVRSTPNGLMISPLGFDRYTRQTFGNRDFIVNLVNYMCNDNGLMQLRNRNVQLRLLDRSKTINDATEWKLINTLIPTIIIVILGLLAFFLRKRKYTH
jgi:gliding-associated putative ABC transporter substrate-binding component GldG